MILEQINLLQSIGKELLKDGKIPQAVLTFKEAREIMREFQHDSINIFGHFCSYASLNPSFPLYAEFCSRNKLLALSEIDYDTIFNPSTLNLLE